MISRDNLRNLIKTKKEESKNISGPIVHRKGHKPTWVDEESDSDDIFKYEQQEFDQEENLKNENQNIRQVIEPAENNQKIVIEDPRTKRLSLENNSNILREENERFKIRREIIKSEIINKSEEVKYSENVKDNVNKENNNLGNKNDTLQQTIGQTIDLSKRRQIIKSTIIQTQEESKPQPISQQKPNNNDSDEDELLELIGGDDEENNESSQHKNSNQNFSQQNYKNESEPSSDDENAEDEDDEVLMRPIFVSKENRQTLNEQLQREQEEKEALEQQERLKELKRKQTKEIVKKYIQQDEENISKEKSALESEKLEGEEQMPDDTDNLDDLTEYESWKLRELRRIKIQFEEDEKKLKEKLELERRRNLTDEQRKEENLRLGSDDTLKPFKSKLNFLQKFYHKGVFFQQEGKEDLSHIYNRDYNLPTWEDKVDRSNLPKILQVRRGLQFKKGRTKYTHLTGEDTTNFDPNFKVPDFISNKFMSNLGGYKAQNDFDLTKKKRK
jgi:microfibrillar-associated protein 1